MNAGTRLAAFGVGALALFGAAFGVGRAIGPIGAEPAPHGADHPSSTTTHPGGHEGGRP